MANRDIGGVNVHIHINNVSADLFNPTTMPALDRYPTSGYLDEGGGNGVAFDDGSFDYFQFNAMTIEADNGTLNSKQAVLEGFINGNSKWEFWVWDETGFFRGYEQNGWFDAGNWDTFMHSGRHVDIVAHYKGSENWVDGSRLQNEDEKLSFCNEFFYWMYDDVADTVSVTFNGGTDFYVIATSVMSQSEVKDLLEASYPIGTWRFAWNVSTGEICIIQDSTEGTGQFEYSIDLEDEISLGDSASAEIVSRYPVERSRWV